MAHENIPVYPRFDATIEICSFGFDDVLNQDRLKKVLAKDETTISTDPA